MNKLLLITLAGALMIGCAAQEEAVKAYHPTDDVSAQSQGGKGFTADGSEVQLVTPDPVKAFHPTDSDALSTQGGKGEVGDGSEVHLDQVNWFKVIKLSFKVKREWDYLMILLR